MFYMWRWTAMSDTMTVTPDTLANYWIWIQIPEEHEA